MDLNLPEKCRDILCKGINSLGLSCDQQQQNELLSYIALLNKWNKAYNLTAIRDPEAMIVRHLLDSLSVSTYLEGENIIDVGTGPGIPGIPLAIIYPNRRFTLLDSNGKKSRFINQAKQSLAMKNINVIQNRVEEYQPEETFDCIVSRAFTSLQQMVQKSGHLIDETGIIQAMKGTYPEPEQQPLPALWKIEKIIKLTVPELDEQRHLVNIKRLENN